ncbi:hypothetical protein PR048_021527 [Dryococelus australis]|uniref:Uncharacterized protein n=1 Tax=Dryococelus australis TaxID=614101 RepID=A0ABQ9GYI2_9NEOP|nr:hypothetical protein PR048_021527 [Dryococelus australis]
MAVLRGELFQVGTTGWYVSLAIGKYRASPLKEAPWDMCVTERGNEEIQSSATPKYLDVINFTGHMSLRAPVKLYAGDVWRLSGTATVATVFDNEKCALMSAQAEGHRQLLPCWSGAQLCTSPHTAHASREPFTPSLSATDHSTCTHLHTPWPPSEVEHCAFDSLAAAPALAQWGSHSRRPGRKTDCIAIPFDASRGSIHIEGVVLFFCMHPVILSRMKPYVAVLILGSKAEFTTETLRTQQPDFERIDSQLCMTSCAIMRQRNGYTSYLIPAKGTINQSEFSAKLFSCKNGGNVASWRDIRSKVCSLSDSNLTKNSRSCERVNEEIWTALNIEVLRAGEEPRENPSTNGIVRHDSHMRKSGVTRPEIEPGSPWWEASRLTAHPP